jgi:hypothetical protein
MSRSGSPRPEAETVSIQFHTGTDAFTNSTTGEIEWVLNDLIRQFTTNGGPDDGRVYDSFGNEIGTVTVQWR